MSNQFWRTVRIDYPCIAKEYEEYTTISYRPKN